jgi:hypothetical protein
MTPLHGQGGINYAALTPAEESNGPSRITASY